MRRFVSAYGWMMVAALLLGGCDEEQRVVNNEPDDDEAITEFANEKAHCFSGGMNVSLISEFR